MRSVRSRAAETPAESVTRTETGEAPATVVEPAMAPEGASEMPDGRDPCARLQEYGGDPPAAVSAAEYAAPAAPSGRPVVVMVSAAGATVIDSDLVAFCDALSLTRTVNVELPAAVGVPLMAPLELSVKPGGRFPDVMLHVYGFAPPLATSVAE
jgi:hypothetical protein